MSGAAHGAGGGGWGGRGTGGEWWGRGSPHPSRQGSEEVSCWRRTWAQAERVMKGTLQDRKVSSKTGMP